MEEVLFALDVHSVGVSEYRLYTAERVLDSVATNKAFFILRR